MRLLNICVIGALVLAAAYVYKIKFESTRQAERVAKLRMEIRREHDAIAALRAEWSKLDSPLRIEELAQRHLKLKSVEATQFDRLDKLARTSARAGAAGYRRSDRLPDRQARIDRSADIQPTAKSQPPRGKKK